MNEIEKREIEEHVKLQKDRLELLTLNLVRTSELDSSDYRRRLDSVVVARVALRELRGILRDLQSAETPSCNGE